MNLHHLELFYHVARSGGISRALRQIPYGIQQPAVSIQMLRLEEHLGLRLFERQPFRLTAEGQELFEFVRPFFDQVDAVEERLKGKRSPVFRIAASELVLRDYLPAVIQRLKQLHPDLRFRLRSGLQAEIERWLIDGEIDLAITPLDAPPKPVLRSETLTRLPLVLAVPEACPVKSATELWGQDPIREPLICLPAGESIAKVFIRGLRQLKVEWPTAIETSSTDLVSQYVANGYGIGVTVDVPGLVQRPGLRVVPLPGFDPVEIVALWCASNTALHHEVRAAIMERAKELFPAASRRARKTAK